MKTIADNDLKFDPPVHPSKYGVDIVVVTYNSSRFLKGLVRGLVLQQYDLSRVRLIFYDNASSDASVSMLHDIKDSFERRFREIIVLTGEKNIGFGNAVNAAARRGREEFIFVLNPDTEPPPTSLGRLMAEALADSPETAAWEARQAPYEHPKTYDPVTLETPWVSCAACLFRRSAFESIGGFDSAIFLYGEDVDISFRLRASGFKLRYVPRAVVIHHAYPDPEKIKPSQFIGSTRSNLYLRTRFGTWRDILKGVRMQIGLFLFPSRQCVPRQRRLILEGLVIYAMRFRYFRRPFKRTLNQKFHYWEYTPIREGAFHDITAGVNATDAPKASVLIRTTGRRRFLSMALASVANQTWPNVEVVVVEDGEATVREILGGFESLDIEYKALGEKKERCAAGNEAMRMASGEYFVFLDDDDMFYADHIEQLVTALMSNHAKMGFSYSFEIPTDYGPDGRSIAEEGDYIARYQRPYSLAYLLFENFMPNNSVMFHRSLFEECGGFDEEITSVEDWDLWLRFSLKTKKVVHVPKTTALYRYPLHERDQYAKYYARLASQKILLKKQADLPIDMTVGEFRDLI